MVLGAAGPLVRAAASPVSISLQARRPAQLFETTSANEYYVLPVTPGFLNNEPFSPPDPIIDPPPSETLLSDLSRLASAGMLQRMNNQDCIRAYTAPLVNEFSNLILVTSNRTSDNSVLGYLYYCPTSPQGTSANYDWICSIDDEDYDGTSTCDYAAIIADAAHFNLTFGFRGRGGIPLTYFIDYCLLQPTKSYCTIQIIPQILAVVMICNALKVVCLLFAVFKSGFLPLVTLGDGLATFLNQPDQHTKDLGPLSASDVRAAQERVKVDKILYRRRKTYDRLVGDDSGQHTNAIEKLPLAFGPWEGKRHRWFSGASGIRWGLTYTLMLGLWGIGWAVWTVAACSTLQGLRFADQWNTGFGNVSPQYLLESTAGLPLFGNILVANAPQLVLSFAYLSYNGLLTCILLSREFASYARRRKGLRVSMPESRFQRSSCWLTLPYQFSLPLLGLSGLLHWALSQTIFLAEVKVLDAYGNPDPQYSVNCLGYSTLALLITMTLGTVGIFSPIALGCIRYDRGAPLVESCSLAISAACHSAAEGQPAEANQLIKYGVLPANGSWSMAGSPGLEAGERTGQRVSLTSSPVAPLELGHAYSSHPAMSPVALSELSSAHLPRPRWRKALGATLFVLNLCKLASCATLSVFIFIPNFFTGDYSDSGPYSGLNPQTFRFWDILFGSLSFGFLSFTVVYLLVRMLVELVRKRKKWGIRLFGWHVFVEVVFLILWLVLLVVVIEQEAWILEHVEPQSNTGALRPDPAVACSASLIVFYALSVGGETWLWWKYH